MLDEFLNFLRIAAGGVKTADQAAHAGAGHQVHRHMMFVEPLQHANMGQAQRSAAFEHQADFLTMQNAAR